MPCNTLTLLMASQTIISLLQSCSRKFSGSTWPGTVELFVLTDGEDRHSKLTLETAKSRLQAPQIRCGRRHSFAATLLSVNMSQRGQRAIDSLASAADHVRTMSVSNSGSCVRKSFRTVLQQIIQRTTTTIVATARR